MGDGAITADAFDQPSAVRPEGLGARLEVCRRRRRIDPRLVAMGASRTLDVPITASRFSQLAADALKIPLLRQTTRPTRKRRLSPSIAETVRPAWRQTLGAAGLVTAAALLGQQLIADHSARLSPIRLPVLADEAEPFSAAAIPAQYPRHSPRPAGLVLDTFSAVARVREGAGAAEITGTAARSGAPRRKRWRSVRLSARRALARPALLGEVYAGRPSVAVVGERDVVALRPSFGRRRRPWLSVDRSIIPTRKAVEDTLDGANARAFISETWHEGEALRPCSRPV